MSIFEYDEEKHIKGERELAYQEGLKHGEKIGLKRGEERLNQLYKRLFDENRIEDLRRSMEDIEYQQKLYAEYNI